MINYSSYQSSPEPAYGKIPTVSPYKFPGTHEDVYKMLSAQNSAGLQAQRDQALTDFRNERLSQQQKSALAGLSSLAQQREQQMNLANQRQGMGLSAVNNILSGLFR